MAEKFPNYEECLLTRRQNSQTGQRAQTKSLKGPLRVVRLCVLGIMLPCLLVSLILYMRYRVYVEQLYPLAVSDMRMLDNRISTTWCQRQLVRTNATFNAFLLPETPTISYKHKPMTMVRHLELEDDTKEYWGFYLLRGSTVTISSCVRWPGASLIVIRGHKHLHECAYIGDNSSEELDEMMEAIREGTYKTETGDEVVDTVDNNAPSNTPNLMKRHREDVKFHDPIHNATTSKTNHTLGGEGLDTTDVTDPKVLKKILDSLNEKAPRKPHVHVHRNSTIGKGETGNFDFENKSPRFMQSTTTDSEEIISDVLRKLHNLGVDRGGNLLEKLNARYALNKSTGLDQQQQENVIHIRGRQYHKPAVQFDDNIDKARRRRRELILQTAELSETFNKNDETDDVGQEEGFVPDGIADHHATLNENTLNDMSNSEFWSSFSSSEEALLNCAGLILNLPLSPHTKCQRSLSDQDVETAYLANRITYKVPTNGYYFFVFNSENEVQTNYIRVHFHIEKTVYNVTNPISECANSTEQCALDLKFFSDEKLVMELPIKEDQDLFNQEYVVVSVCEPRTAIYIFCVILVPILVILFAFQ
ncbi:uncharacterized protein [Atheta coriaria]|uniref:uncharacterized protein isoform X2 n=1 Tax=Dalotia coriaria TaxID=877792 RepID=UPI0031F40FB9